MPPAYVVLGGMSLSKDPSNPSLARMLGEILCIIAAGLLVATIILDQLG